jgi:acyl-CoA synthetase (AMP-forming)/AMP-acid ligase II
VNLAWWLQSAALEYGERTALIDPHSGAEHTYEELSARTARVAAVLHQQGVGEDDIVVTLMPDDDWHFCVFFATMKIGAVFCGFNRTLNAEKHQDDVERLRARTIVVSRAHLDRAEKLLAETCLERIIVCDPEGSFAYPDLVALASAAVPFERVVPRSESQLCAVNFTGGTSGVSKGVMFTHGALGLSTRMSVVLNGITSEDRNLSVISLFHSGGIADAVRWTMIGGTNILTGAWDVDAFVSAIERHRPTFIFAMVPTMVRDWMRHPRFDELELTGIRASLGGETVPDGMRQTLRDRGMRVVSNYGLTESMPWCALGNALLWGDDALCPEGSVGKPLPELCEVVLKDPASGAVVVEPGVSGEVCIRGGIVSPGYYNDPESTAAAFDAEGWFHTRDIASFDENGWYYVRGRVDDIINCGGEKVSLVEIEDLLKSAPHVLDVACVGVPHERFGLVPAAVVVLSADLRPDDMVAVLDAYVLERTERWKRPRLYVSVTQVPRTHPKRTKDIRAMQRLVDDVLLRDGGEVQTLEQWRAERPTRPGSSGVSATPASVP